MLFFHVLWTSQELTNHSYFCYSCSICAETTAFITIFILLFSVLFIFFSRWIIVNCKMKIMKSNDQYTVVIWSCTNRAILMAIEWMDDYKWLKMEWMKNGKTKWGHKEYKKKMRSEEYDWVTFLRPFHCLNKPVWELIPKYAYVLLFRSEMHSEFSGFRSEGKT